MIKQGILYLCPTPIGNLEDITLRGLRILKEADLIAAEDTRVTIKLLSHFDIKTPLMSYHEHNKRTQGPRLISFLQAGKDIALVTDAGTPGLSDPGGDLVRDAIKERIRVVPLPGATAAICALVASGFSTERFVFKGFLPRKTKEQKQRLLGLMSEQRTIVIYEAPHRIIKTLEALKDVFKNRRVAIAREITKIHEEFIYGTLEDVIKGFKTKKPRGEMVIVVEGSTSQATPSLWEKGVKPTLSDIELVDLLQSIIRENTREGLSKNTALRSAAEKLGLSRNEAYELLIKETKKERPE